MTSSNGNLFRVTGPLWGEFTHHRGPSPVNSPHKGQWCGALMFSLICAWINSWVNNWDAGDLKHHCAHYDVTIMNHRNFVTLVDVLVRIVVPCISGQNTQRIDLKLGVYIHYAIQKTWSTYGHTLLNSSHSLASDWLNSLWTCQVINFWSHFAEFLPFPDLWLGEQFMHTCR